MFLPGQCYYNIDITAPFVSIIYSMDIRLVAKLRLPLAGEPHFDFAQCGAAGGL